MDIKPGIYIHSKTGKQVRLHFVAKHSETLEDMVCYEELGPNDVSRFWIRPVKMWFEEVMVNGETKSRFVFVASDA